MKTSLLFLKKINTGWFPTLHSVTSATSNGTADFSKWKLYSTYNKEAIEKYVSPKAKHYDNIAFNYFLQYHLHLQLKAAVDYAYKNGVIIKGDIPIGVSPR